MKEQDQIRIAARLARVMAMICVRNSMLEDLHAGQAPITRTGDYSDVFVIDADGMRIPWTEVSRIDNDEMRNLMRQIVNRLYTFHIKADDPAFRDEIERWLPIAEKWDEPSEDAEFIRKAGEPEA